MKKVKKIVLSADTIIKLIDELQASVLTTELFLQTYPYFEEDKKVYVLSKLELFFLKKIIEKLLLYHSKILMINGKSLSIAVLLNTLEIEVILVNIRNDEIIKLFQPFASINYLTN